MIIKGFSFLHSKEKRRSFQGRQCVLIHPFWTMKTSITSVAIHLIFFTLALMFNVFGAHAQNKPTTIIPFELGTANRIYITCSVNGSQPLRFLVDTGAVAMVISTHCLQDVPMEFQETIPIQGATGTADVKKSTGNRFTIGDQHLEDVPFLAIPYSKDQWDGVLGLWFIDRQVTEINYTDRNIYLYPHGTYTPPPHAIRLPIDNVIGLPVVPVQVTINGVIHRLRLSVDTGSDRVLDLNTPFVKKHHLLESQRPFSISQVSSSDSHTGVLNNVIFDSIQLGSFKLPLIPGAFSTITDGVQSSEEMDGVMGNNLLKRFNLVYDSKAKSIYLIPNNLLYTPFYECLLCPPSSNEATSKQ